ncbi:MAG TPA: hypothetical protein VEZ43_01380 [Dongiaceae bacterium]|nr:hypothetical protein [Dongiaceae bacterium]
MGPDLSQKPCKFCGKTISWDTSTGKPVPKNPDGSRHDCRTIAGPAKPQNTNEHQEFENQKASFSPAMENEIRRIIKEEFKAFLQWMASQAEGQA